MSENGLIIGENKGALVKAASGAGVGDLLKPMVTEIHLFDTYVAGTTYLADTTPLGTIAVGDKLSLLREQNKFDVNAIVIRSEDGAKLGYVPEKDNVVFARLMDAGKMLIARIKSITLKGTMMQIAIGIYLVDF